MKIKGMLYGACALLVSSIATPAMAASTDFAGPYIAIQASVNGVELDGSTTDSNSEIHNGQGGIFGITGGFELGYNMPLGEILFVGLGASINPGDVRLNIDGGLSNDADSDDVTIDFKDLVTIYIQPAISVGDNSAIYFKAGRTKADLSVTGDVTKLSSVDGHTFSIGTASLFPSGAFVKTEAGVTSFDNIKVTGLGTYVATTNSAEADPTSAFGQITIGYQF